MGFTRHVLRRMPNACKPVKDLRSVRGNDLKTAQTKVARAGCEHSFSEQGGPVTISLFHAITFMASQRDVPPHHRVQESSGSAIVQA
jgi:hypothetical protein